VCVCVSRVNLDLGLRQDDTSFVPDFINTWNLYMERFNGTAWDVIFFGLGDKNFVDEGGIFMEKEHPASRTAGSYAISGRAAAKLMSSMVPFTTVSDGELDYQMWIHRMKVYWAAPHLAWEATKGCPFYKVSARRSVYSDYTVVFSMTHSSQAGSAFKSVVDPQRWKQERTAWRKFVEEDGPSKSGPSIGDT
jgi:hypothetical protein